MRRVELLPSHFASLLAAQEPGCASSAGIRKHFESNQDLTLHERLRGFESVFARSPRDFFLRKTSLETTAEDTRLRDTGAENSGLRHRPSGPMAETLAAYSWLGEDTARAIRDLEAVRLRHPEFAWPSYSFATILSRKRYIEKEAAANHGMEFLESCRTT